MAIPVRVLAVAVTLTAWPVSGQGLDLVNRPLDPVVARRYPRSGKMVRTRTSIRPPRKGVSATYKPSTLAPARTLLAEVKRDPVKRRYRHHWERAIRALERAARGQDAPVALLEAARARYGLYRFSAVEADRDEALALGARATRAGSREAAAFVKAVRREAGDEELTKRPSSPPVANFNGTGSSTVSTATPKPDDEDEPDDPILEDSDANTQEVVREVRKEGAGGEKAMPSSGPVRVSEVKTWSNSDYTRVAIYLSRATHWQKEEITAGGDRPRRLAIDFKSAILEGKAVAKPVGDAQVQRVRVAQRDSETVRVVLDLAGRDAYQLFSLEDPPRLIVDVGAPPAQPEPQVVAEPSQEAEPTPQSEERGAGESLETPAERAIRRVVIDAGHGGHDPGAIGPTGVREKDVVLEMAKRLSQKLRTMGFDVVLTRRGDVFLPLEERTAIANASHGDLFISLHANAHPRRERRGVETYYLNVADGRYAARLAARENGTLSLEATQGAEIQRILSDLNANASAGASRHFAQLVQHELCSGVRAHLGEVRNLGVQSALFYVLLGARMPAVLVETGFISNRVEEQRLVSARYQEEIASDIARAIVVFAGREPRMAVAK